MVSVDLTVGSGAGGDSVHSCQGWAQIFIGHSTHPYVNARDAITKRK